MIGELRGNVALLSGAQLPGVGYLVPSSTAMVVGSAVKGFTDALSADQQKVYASFKIQNSRLIDQAVANLNGLSESDNYARDYVAARMFEKSIYDHLANQPGGLAGIAKGSIGILSSGVSDILGGLRSIPGIRGIINSSPTLTKLASKDATSNDLMAASQMVSQISEKLSEETDVKVINSVLGKRIKEMKLDYNAARLNDVTKTSEALQAGANAGASTAGVASVGNISGTLGGAVFGGVEGAVDAAIETNSYIQEAQQAGDIIERITDLPEATIDTFARFTEFVTGRVEPGLSFEGNESGQNLYQLRINSPEDIQDVLESTNVSSMNEGSVLQIVGSEGVIANIKILGGESLENQLNSVLKANTAFGMSVAEAVQQSSTNAASRTIDGIKNSVSQRVAQIEEVFNKDSIRTVNEVLGYDSKPLTIGQQIELSDGTIYIVGTNPVDGIFDPEAELSHIRQLDIQAQSNLNFASQGSDLYASDPSVMSDMGGDFEPVDQYPEPVPAEVPTPPPAPVESAPAPIPAADSAQSPEPAVEVPVTVLSSDPSEGQPLPSMGPSEGDVVEPGEPLHDEVPDGDVIIDGSQRIQGGSPDNSEEVLNSDTPEVAENSVLAGSGIVNPDASLTAEATEGNQPLPGAEVRVGVDGPEELPSIADTTLDQDPDGVATESGPETDPQVAATPESTGAASDTVETTDEALNLNQVLPAGTVLSIDTDDGYTGFTTITTLEGETAQQAIERAQESRELPQGNIRSIVLTSEQNQTLDGNSEDVGPGPESAESRTSTSSGFYSFSNFSDAQLEALQSLQTTSVDQVELRPGDTIRVLGEGGIHEVMLVGDENGNVDPNVIEATFGDKIFVNSDIDEVLANADSGSDVAEDGDNLPEFGSRAVLPDFQANPLLTLDLASGEFTQPFETVEDTVQIVGHLAGELEKVEVESYGSVQEIANLVLTGQELPEDLANLSLPGDTNGRLLYNTLFQNPEVAKQIAEGSIALTAVAAVDVDLRKEGHGMFLPLPGFIFASGEYENNLSVLVAAENQLAVNTGFNSAGLNSAGLDSFEPQDFEPTYSREGNILTIRIPAVNVIAEGSESEFVIRTGDNTQYTITDPETISRLQTGSTSDVLDIIKEQDPDNPLVADRVELSEASDKPIIVSYNNQEYNLDDLLTENAHLFFTVRDAEDNIVGNENVSRAILDESNIALFTYLLSDQSNLTQEQKATLFENVREAQNTFGTTELLENDPRFRFYKSVANQIEDRNPELFNRDTIYQSDLVETLNGLSISSADPAQAAARLNLLESYRSLTSRFNYYPQGAGNDLTIEQLEDGINGVLDYVGDNLNDYNLTEAQLKSIIQDVNADSGNRAQQIAALQSIFGNQAESSETYENSSYRISDKGFGKIYEGGYTYNNPNIYTPEEVDVIRETLDRNPDIVRTREAITIAGLLPIPNVYLDPTVNKVVTSIGALISPISGMASQETETSYSQLNFTPEEVQLIEEIATLSIEAMNDPTIAENYAQLLRGTGNNGLTPEEALIRSIPTGEETGALGSQLYYIVVNGERHYYNTPEERDIAITGIVTARTSLLEVQAQVLDSSGRTSSDLDIIDNPVVNSILQGSQTFTSEELDRMIENETDEAARRYLESIRETRSELSNSSVNIPREYQTGLTPQQFADRYGFYPVGSAIFGNGNGGVSAQYFAGTSSNDVIIFDQRQLDQLESANRSIQSLDMEIENCKNDGKVAVPDQDQVVLGSGQASEFGNQSNILRDTWASLFRERERGNFALIIRPRIGGDNTTQDRTVEDKPDGPDLGQDLNTRPDPAATGPGGPNPAPTPGQPPATAPGTQGPPAAPGNPPGAPTTPTAQGAPPAAPNTPSPAAPPATTSPAPANNLPTPATPPAPVADPSVAQVPTAAGPAPDVVSGVGEIGASAVQGGGTPPILRGAPQAPVAPPNSSVDSLAK
jgi:hypothetical protein